MWIKNMGIQIRKIAVVLTIVACILSAAAVSAIPLSIACGGNGENVSRPDFDHSTVTVIRADGTHFSFKAGVATSDKDKAYGLMFVCSMPDEQCMIFPYASPMPVAFWMKNTLIPLDMLFVRSDGVIGQIEAEERPQDKTAIHSHGPVSAVIEINGGLAKKYGLSRGIRWNLRLLRHSS
jgi:uncharacterized membrane protein (UPF0127 family)